MNEVRARWQREAKCEDISGKEEKIVTESEEENLRDTEHSEERIAVLEPCRVLTAVFQN